MPIIGADSEDIETAIISESSYATEYPPEVSIKSDSKNLKDLSTELKQLHEKEILQSWYKHPGTNILLNNIQKARLELLEKCENECLNTSPSIHRFLQWLNESRTLRDINKLMTIK